MAPYHSHIQLRDADSKLKIAQVLRAEFLSHQCTEACLIHRSEASLAGLDLERDLNNDEINQCKLSLSFQPTSKKRKAPEAPNVSRKVARISDEAAISRPFPVILSQTEKDDIVREFRAATNNHSLERHECSFCGKLESAVDIKMKAVHDLDISLLNRAVEKLREVSRQNRIQSFEPSSLINNSYVLCHLCCLSVAHKKFSSIPVRSYANGLWIGKIPIELCDLTFLEEQCIARARATRCMYKISLGPSGQFAARGNVCILPQDSASLLN
ncbi:hypothetical protein R3P38DRAFT_2581420, partial [Favolaschia claudopus]